MKVIYKQESKEFWRITCPACESVIEGEPEEFKNKTSVSLSWWEFECPICKRKREINDAYMFGRCSKLKKIYYKYDPVTKEIGDVLREEDYGR